MENHGMAGQDDHGPSFSWMELLAQLLVIAAVVGVLVVLHMRR
jgi:hypothetical protein